MKSKKKEMMVGLISFAIIWIIAFVVLINMPTSSFKDKSKYTIEEHYVSSGESAWDIYKDTCPNSNWNDWCNFVKKINSKTSLEKITVGESLKVPIPNN